MPGRLHPQLLRHELGCVPQFLRVVVDAGDDQRGHLHPDGQPLHHLQAVEHRLQPRTHVLAIGLVAERLQVHVGRVQVRVVLPSVSGGVKSLQHLPRHVAAGDVDVGQAGLVGQAGRVVGVLEEDSWLSVSIGNAAAASPLRGGDDLLRAGLLTYDKMPLADHLGDLPVLAPAAAKVAARRGDGVGGRARIEVQQRLLLHRVHVLGDSAPVDQRVERTAPVLPHQADTPLPVGDHTAVSAQGATHAVVR